jgi:hypothetical protein
MVSVISLSWELGGLAWSVDSASGLGSSWGSGSWVVVAFLSDSGGDGGFFAADVAFFVRFGGIFAIDSLYKLNKVKRGTRVVMVDMSQDSVTSLITHHLNNVNKHYACLNDAPW